MSLRGHIHSRSSAGFTLVEVLLAVGILASLSGLMWISIAGMFKSRDVVEQRSQRHHEVRVTMNRMSHEIAAAYIAGPKFGGEEIPGETASLLEGSEDEVLARINDEPKQFGMIGRDDSLHFTTFAHVRTLDRERASNHAEIGYFMRTERDDETGRMVKQLVRREDTSSDDDLTRGGVIYTMLAEVEDVRFEYWDAGQVELGTFEEIAQGRWVSEWDTTRRDHAGRLPTRVRMSLILPPQGNNREPEKFVTQTQLGVTEVLDF